MRETGPSSGIGYGTGLLLVHQENVEDAKAKAKRTYTIARYAKDPSD